MRISTGGVERGGDLQLGLTHLSHLTDDAT